MRSIFSFLHCVVLCCFGNAILGQRRMDCDCRQGIGTFSYGWGENDYIDRVRCSERG